MRLNLSLDLGSDSLKIVYAYRDADDHTHFGKITASDSLVRVAFPAVAFFDDNTDAWVYGDRVDRQYNTSFVKVVKIKDLLSLLMSERNTPFYDDHHFPKFFFPRNANAFDDYKRAIEEAKTFTQQQTPREVCEGFFLYAKSIILERIRALEEEIGTSFESDLNIALIHPLKATKPYIAELSRLVTNTFGVEPNKVISSTKALGTYAKRMNKVKENCDLLVFDMGEEDISVSKMFVGKGGELFVDGVEGHMDPLHIGGINIDYAIAEFVENDIRERDTVGTPPSASQQGGHIYEDALVSKQYLFMKGIKKAKVILSREFDEDENVFRHGAPIGIYYEIFVQRMLTHEQIAKCIGISEDSGLANQILGYILEELKKPLNAGLTSSIELAQSNPRRDFGYVVLSGGLSDTFALRSYIEENIKKEHPTIDVLTLEAENSDGGEFAILKNESAAYAAAIGGAFTALYDEQINTILSYSYGTWVDVDGVRCLDIFIDRGQLLESDNMFTIKYGFSSRVEGERLYSTVVTKRDIERGTYRGEKLDVKISTQGKRYLHIGKDRGDPYRDSIQDLLKLQTVAGGDDACIRAYYMDDEISSICENKTSTATYISVRQGISVDDNGKITPTYGVHPAEGDRKVRLYFYGGRRGIFSDSVLATDIEIRGPKISATVAQS